MVAAESASSPSKPAFQPEATTSAEKSLTDTDAALAPKFFQSDQVTPQAQADTPLAEDHLKNRLDPAEINRAPQPRERQTQSRQKPRTAASSKPPVVHHEVKWPQETFFSIALWYTGSGHNWRQIAEANPAIAPRQIHIGDTISIPIPLIRTREPLPYSFLKNRKRSG
jgi:hypothetical protein